MKVLNRPMFRMGGPIKEGIMDGIKEPVRQGYANGPGFVIQNDPNKMTVNKLLENQQNAAAAFSNIFANQKPIAPMKVNTTAPQKNTFSANIFAPDEDPLSSDFDTTEIIDGKVVTKPAEGLDPVTKAKIKANLGIINRDEFLDVVKTEELKKKQEAPIETSTTIQDVNRDDRGVTPDVPLVSGDDKSILPETKKERVSKILDSLGYKRAQKNALYDAMIKAGQRISRTGLGAENLVSDVIAETSQSYDKPEKLREAAQLMATQQDLKLEQIEAGKTGGTMQQNYEYFLDRGFSDEESQLKAAGLATNIQEAKSIGLKQNLKGNQLTESVAQQLILTDTYKNPTYKGTINAKEYKSVSEFAKSKDFDGAGVYIVKGRIVELDENGNKLKEDIVTSSSSDKKWWNPLD